MLLTDETFKRDFISLMNKYGKDYLLITNDFYLVGLQNDSQRVKREVIRFLNGKNNTVPQKPDMKECYRTSGLFVK